MYGKIDFVQIMNGGEFIPCYFNNDLLIKINTYTCPYSLLCPDQEQITENDILYNLYRSVIDVVLVFLFLTLNRFTHCSGVSMVGFEQVNAGWE